jgi:hypothetical protein
MKHPQAIEMREGLLHIWYVQGPKKTGSVESRLEAVEQEVFLCKGIVERGLDANHLMFKDFARICKEEDESMWDVVSKWIDYLQGQIYDLQCQNLEYEARLKGMSLAASYRISETFSSSNDGEPLTWKLEDRITVTPPPTPSSPKKGDLILGYGHSPWPRPSLGELPRYRITHTILAFIFLSSILSLLLLS